MFGGIVTQQLETLLADVRIDAVKIGMLRTGEVTRGAVAELLHRHLLPYVVVDLVTVCQEWGPAAEG